MLCQLRAKQLGSHSWQAAELEQRQSLEERYSDLLCPQEERPDG